MNIKMTNIRRLIVFLFVALPVIAPRGQAQEGLVKIRVDDITTPYTTVITFNNTLDKFFGDSVKANIFLDQSSLFKLGDSSLYLGAGLASYWRANGTGAFVTNADVTGKTSGIFGYVKRNATAPESGTLSPATATDTIKAPYFSGDGSLLTGLSQFWSRSAGTLTPTTNTDTLFVNYLKSTGYISLTSAIGTVADSWLRRVSPGRFVLGTTATDSAGILSLGRIFLSANSYSPLIMDTYSNTLSVSSAVTMRKARGTASSPLAIGSGDWIWGISGDGHNGTGFVVTETARIIAIANGAISGITIPTYLRFDTSPGTGNMTERVRIDQNGNVGIGTTNPQDKVSTVSAFATNLNAFNFYNSDYNKNVSTAAQERDSSSIAAWFSGAGTPTFAIVNAVGATQFKSDSVATLVNALRIGGSGFALIDSAKISADTLKYYVGGVAYNAVKGSGFDGWAILLIIGAGIFVCYRKFFFGNACES